MSNRIRLLEENLPEEMRWSRQWCIAGPDKAPYTVGKNDVLFRADVTDPTQRMDFETAIELAEKYNASIGYVLQANDSLTCIDLDVKDKDNEKDPTKWTTQEQFDRFWAIVQTFDTYTEKSLSGKGLHIWVRGNIGKGCRRDGVEVYSQERFMICTGDVIAHKPIKDGQFLLEQMTTQMFADETNNTSALVELEATESDDVIWNRAGAAANNDKFGPLVAGLWQELGYPSQSEADLSLMSMFCFYSKSNDQCKRLFRMSELGKREKAIKNDRYLNYTLSRIRARQEREEIEQASAQQLGAALIQKLQAEADKPKPPPASIAMASMVPLPVVTEEGIAWPPGLVGNIAGYIYRSAPRPVKEVAIVAALGLMAGICGKAFCIPGSGLNLYIILAARSAIGKEAMHSGIASLMAAVSASLPAAMQFVDYSDFASGPALSKAVAGNPSFVNVAGEWGRKLKRLAKEDRVEGPMQQLRTVMTNLYQKSGSNSVVGGITYSNKDQNILSVSGVAYSMIGETTPSTLYESLTDSMMEDGFLSRFTIIEYKGERPAHNYAAVKQPDQALTSAIAQLCNQSLMLVHQNKSQDVGRTDPAGEILFRFDRECDDHINSTDVESFRQMWNRAALKVLRISALLAVADNFTNPIIDTHHVTWAMDLVRRDIEMMTRKMADGDIGVDDSSREKKILSICKHALMNGFAASYNVSKAMAVDAVIPRKFILNKLSKHPAFATHRYGATNAIDSALKSIIDNGSFIEVTKENLVKKYQFHGRAFQVINFSALEDN